MDSSNPSPGESVLSRRAIRKAVAALDTAQLGIPVPIEDIIKRMGGDIIPIDGHWYVKVVRDRPPVAFEIGVDRSLTEKRRRQVLAQLLGHYVLHLKDPNPEYPIDSGVIRDRPEFRAGWQMIVYEGRDFAGEILLPYNEFVAAMGSPSVETIEALLGHISAKFNVSKPFARTRAQELGLYPLRG